MPLQSPRVTLRPADERGATDLGWLDSKHSFSFGHYHDPRKMSYHGLRVLNDDRVAPGTPGNPNGFDTHPHRDMEILTWVLGGELAHQDSMGHASTLGPGSIQLMSAGTGVTHSEFNARSDAPVHFLQVWIEPRQRGAAPRYQEAQPDPATRNGRFAPLATPDGGDGSLTIGADAEVYVGDFAPGQSATLDLTTGRVTYVHVAKGSLTINGQPASGGDAVTVGNQDTLQVSGTAQDSQVLAFVLPA